jgi:two-component system chemotaxis response regulator CheY
MNESGRAKANVVIAEENDEIRKILSDFLMTKGYSVTVYRRPEDLETALDSTTADFILMNVGDGEHVGISTLEKIRNRPEFDAVPVVMLSGERDEAITAKCAACGADGVMTWPYEAESLTENIQALLAGEKVPLVTDPRESGA